MNQSKLLSINNFSQPVEQDKTKNIKENSSNNVDVLISSHYCYEMSKIKPIDLSPNPFICNLKQRLVHYGGYEEVWNDDFTL